MTQPVLEETNWTCPYCGAKNVDYKKLTAIPLCSECNRDVHWDEIVETSNDPKPYMSVDRNFRVTIHEENA